MQIGDDGRIDIAAAARHHQAFQRGEAHRGVQGPPARKGGDRAAAAELQADQPTPAGQLRMQLLPPVQHRLMREAVKPVASNALVGTDVRRDGVFARDAGQTCKKSSVEGRHLYHSGAAHLARCFDPAQCRGIVQRRQLRELGDVREDRLVYPRGAREPCAAVDDTMGDGVGA